MKIVKFVVIVVVFIIALALGSQNQELVTFNYLLAQTEINLSLLLIGAVSFGFLISCLFLIQYQLKAKFQMKRLNNQLKVWQKKYPMDSAK